MMKNIELSRQILTELYRVGVREIAVCAGARNSPLVALIDKCENLKVVSFFEERSAAFFMMGCARRLNAPTAIITTSGTAVAELLPAVIESFHSGVPLIVLSADRPRRLRGTGAPQSIDQTGLFGKFVAQEFDLENEPLAIREWAQQAPLHVNVCFDEPLLDQPIEPWSVKALPATEPLGAPVNDEQLAKFTAFAAKMQKPLIIVGTLNSRVERSAVTALVKMWGAPAFFEGPSGLRGVGATEIRGGEASLGWALREGHFDSVLRIGSVPTARIWRDLEDPRTRKPVLSVAALPFAGLSTGEMIQTDIAAFLVQVVNAAVKPPLSAERTASTERWLKTDAEAAAMLQDLIASEPLAEPSLMHKLSQLIPSTADVYVGNSLPIRQWDWMAARKEKSVAVQANRGVNGIDGQLSTFMGLMAGGAKREGWAIVGDLTAMYDLTAPWARPSVDPNIARIVVINNGGGKIFGRIFNSALFENHHTMNFAPWAQMWNLKYERWNDVPAHLSAALLNQSCVIEITPDEAATSRFHDAHDQFWKTRK